MSKCRIERFTCPECGTEGEYRVWDTINVDLDPDLKEKLLSQELFDWECPGCGQHFSLPYSMIYHDMHRNYMIFFSPLPGDEKRYQPLEVSVERLLLDGYKIRSVYGFLHMREKITILDEGLNDVAIERLKWVLKNIIHPEWRGDAKKLYFMGTFPKDETFGKYGSLKIIFVDNEAHESLIGTFDMALYYELAYTVKLDSRMDLQGNTCVDQEWIGRQLDNDLFNQPSDNGKVGVDRASDGRYWALVDQNGDPITEYKYRWIEPAGEGFFRAMPTGNKYVLLWPDGTEVTREWYNHVGNVEDGYFTVSNTVPKTKTEPTKYLNGLAQVNGAMLFGPDGSWEILHPLREKDEKGESNGPIWAYYAEYKKKPLILTKMGGISDPQKDHLPKELSINTPDFFEKFINWTLPGLQFYYRDTNAPINVEKVYSIGKTLRAGFFVDVTTKLLKPIHRTRFLIASAHAAHLYEMDGKNNGGDKWNLCTFHPNSYFKVMDIYRKGKVTQILLLHIPEAAARFMTNDTIELPGSMFPNGKSLVETARESLDVKMEMDVHPRSWNEVLCNRMRQPIGLDVNSEPYPLPPVEDAYIPEEYRSLSNLVHEMSQDDDIKDFIEEEDKFHWKGVKGSHCDGCIFAQTIRGNGEGCIKKDKENFRNLYFKVIPICDEKKTSRDDRSLREYGDSLARMERDKESDEFALQLVRDFIAIELNDDISKIKDYNFPLQASDTDFARKVEAKFGKKNDRYPRPVKAMDALNAILSLIFKDAWPELTMKTIELNQFGVDQLHHTFPLLGHPTYWSLEEGIFRFKVLDRLYAPQELQKKVATFCQLESTLGNLVIWPQSLTYSQLISKLERPYIFWVDYPDHFLKRLRLGLLDPNKVDDEFRKILTGRKCQKTVADFHSISAFRYLASELVLHHYVDDNGDIKMAYDLVRFDNKDISREKLLEAIEHFVDTATTVIRHRADEMLTTLKYRLRNLN